MAAEEDLTAEAGADSTEEALVEGAASVAGGHLEGEDAPSMADVASVVGAPTAVERTAEDMDRADMVVALTAEDVVRCRRVTAAGA